MGTRCLPISLTEKNLTEIKRKSLEEDFEEKGERAI